MKFRIKKINSAKPVPYWYRIICHFEKKGYIANGLTIPFLIGARPTIEPGQSLLSVEELVHEVSQYGATIMRCGYLDEYVLGSLDQETEAISEYYKKFDKLVVTDDSFSDKKSIDEVEIFLEAIYRPVISANYYSKENGEWRDFSEREFNCLKELQ
ncbi:MAG: hypothetical protein J0I32_11635 [Sphingobacteriales bacterium]|nr:hypothetical protein [Sphingobacteriales bacterium]OJW01072.1 MAG: hypothetical protein BGO52_06445 [Sphingobacteriales bacterium 44-61]